MPDESSAWGFEWGALWGAGTAWPETDGDVSGEGERLTILPGDHDTWETARRRLWKQLEATTSWREQMLLVLGDVFADIEIAQGELDRMHYVSEAEGVWLDEIGLMLKLPRGGQTDDADYALALIAEALSQVTSGTPDEIMDVAIRLAGDDAVVDYVEDGPASFVLTIVDLPAGRFDLMLAVMADMPPAGVGAWLDTYDTAAVAGPGWDPNPTIVGSPGWDPQPAGILATHGWGERIG